MSTLQRLLNLGLVDIGGDDSRFAKMEAASAALVERLDEEPSLLIPATLVAIDHDVDEADPTFDVVEELVFSQWKTMRNTHINRPRELLRSILLDALATFIEGKPEASGAVWCTAVGPLRHGQARLGKEAKLVKLLINGAWKTAETEAAVRAGLGPTVQRKRRKKSSPRAPSLEVSGAIADSDFVQDVARAAGPQYQGQSLPNANPQWPQNNANWSQQFTPRMAAAIAKAVNLGTERLTASLQTALSVYLGDLERRVADQVAKVADASEAAAASTAASRLRLEVLWWSEALYSPTLGVGYRELPNSVVAVAASIDLANIVPPLTPTSASYVLGEVVNRVAGPAHATPKPLVDHLKELSEYDGLRGVPASTGSAGRGPLLDLVCEAAAGTALASDEAVARTGLLRNLALTPAHFAMWVFHDLQARRLVEEV